MIEPIDAFFITDHSVDYVDLSNPLPNFCLRMLYGATFIDIDFLVDESPVVYMA
jgi:hypothetical protein